MTTKPKSFTPEKLHTEEVVERHIVDQLVATQGYEERPSDAFDKMLGLDRDVAVAFIKETQPEVWRTLEGQYPGAAEDEFFRNLEVALKGRGTLEVLREGFKIVPSCSYVARQFDRHPDAAQDRRRVFRQNRPVQEGFDETVQVAHGALL